MIPIMLDGQHESFTVDNADVDNLEQPTELVLTLTNGTTIKIHAMYDYSVGGAYLHIESTQ